MDKKRLVAEAARKSVYAKWEVNVMFDSLIETISESLKNGEKVHINGFGKFEIKQLKQKQVEEEVTPKVTVLFTPSKSLKLNGERLG